MFRMQKELACNKPQSERPNIVFALIDDMGWKDIGCYGSEFYETPNIDRLAQEGMRFTDAYAACPVCSPTRASIMSGKNPASVGVTDWIGAHTKGKLIDAPYIDHLPLKEKSVATSLREGGYDTWHVGKWHLGESSYYPENHGFDVNIAGNHRGAPHNGYFSPYDLENLEDGPDGEYLTDRLTDEAIHLVRNKGDNPFFLYLSHYAVHGPIQSPKHLVEKYEKKAKELGLDKKQTFVTGENFSCEHKKDQHVKRRILQSDADYAAMIENLDNNMGRLFDVLAETGEAENTIVIFTSDNGGLSTAEGSPTCNAPLNEGKGWMYEGGVREPLLVKWPGMTKPGSICNVPVTSPDFYPTLLEMAALPQQPEQHIDGLSLCGLLSGAANNLQREAIYWHYPHYGNQGGTPGSSIRMGDYKLIEFFEDNKLELYNLSEDIKEERNLASEKIDLAKKMSVNLREWRESVKALLPKSNPEFGTN